MIRSAFYILILSVVLVIRTAQNHYLDSIPGLGEWISSSLNSKNEPVEVESDEVPNEGLREVLDASNSNEDMKDAVNHDGPIPVDDLLDQLSDEVKISGDQLKSESAEISKQLGAVLYDNSIGKVKVLMKGIWHTVDLGLAGSSQRKRSAIKANDIAKGFYNGLRRLGKWLRGLVVGDDPTPVQPKPVEPNPVSVSFDARKAWSKCQNLISLIRDQGHVGSSLAVAMASMLSDRLCIASGGTYNQPLSSEDLMRCCPECVKLDEGVVVGGRTSNMLDFLKDHGIVSGGEYGSEKGCLPYSYLPHDHPDYGKNLEKNGECDRKCSNTDYETSYENDKHNIDGYDHYILPKDMAAIKEDLKAKGSCIAFMREYADFLNWYNKKDIYTRNESSESMNDHVIRLIGWGKENGIDYWLVANSRGKNWGNEGIGKINMASGCNFGHVVLCVKPKVPVPNTRPE